MFAGVSCFKPSTKKGDKELEFVPVNLHLQRMTVLNESTNQCNYNFPEIFVIIKISCNHFKIGTGKFYFREMFHTLCKHACAIYNNISRLLKCSFSDEKFVRFFLSFAVNIDCGYTLEPPQ